MTQIKKPYAAAKHASLEVRLQALGDTEIASYVDSLKRKYQRYTMPLDQARKLIDAAMGEKTLSDLLYEAREQAG